MIRNLQQVERLAKKFKIPKEDIILIALNCCGLIADIKDKRLRFKLQLNSSKEIFYLAICVNTGKSPFFLKNGNVFLNQEKIGHVFNIENDTCDTTYFRGHKTVLNINSNCRSKCQGCKFCGTYNQEAKDKHPLLNNKSLGKYLDKIFSDNKISDLRQIKEIAVCTGCFKTEVEIVDHLLMINNYCQNKNFSPRLKYIGSQIKSEESLYKLSKNIKKFSYYLTLECFNRRGLILRPSKREINLNKAINIFNRSRAKNIKITFLYILGLDSLSSIEKNFKKIMPHINSFPVINLMQNFIPEHNKLRHKDSHQIEYYLDARKSIEKIFKSTILKPILWENYRGLWYLKFRQKYLKGIRI